MVAKSSFDVRVSLVDGGKAGPVLPCSFQIYCNESRRRNALHVHSFLKALNSLLEGAAGLL